MGKGETAQNEQFLLFQQCFLPSWRTFSHFPQVQNCRLQTLLVWKILKFVICERVNPLPGYKISDWSELKQIADDILKCIKMENKYHIW